MGEALVFSRSSPACRLGDFSVVVAHDRRKLSGAQLARPDLLEEGRRDRLKGSGATLDRKRVENADRQPESAPNDTDGFGQVTVIADHDSDVAITEERIGYEMRGQVDIRSLSSVLTTATVVGPPGAG